jgi:transcriptional antiterminator RfaH
MSHSPERQWYVVYSKPQKEDCAQFHLQSKGLKVFFPRLLLPESAKRHKRLVPLFPSYLFVRFAIRSDEYHYATWSPGVSRVVAFNGVPVSIEDEIVEFLMQQSDDQGIIAARSNLRAGQEVRITGGPFDGLVGIIQEPPSAKGRVKILLTLLNRPTKVDVPIRFVKSEWVASEPLVQAYT